MKFYSRWNCNITANITFQFSFNSENDERRTKESHAMKHELYSGIAALHYISLAIKRNYLDFNYTSPKTVKFGSF